MRLRFAFERGADSALWAADDEARRAYGEGPIGDALPLSPAARAEMQRLARDFGVELSCCDPVEPGPWRELYCERFDDAAAALLSRLREELPGVDVEDGFVPLVEQTPSSD